MGDPIYDGQESLRGVWGGNPATVPQGYAHNAVNRWFREDENRTRPSIRQFPLEFESEEDRIWFEGGNVQGAFFYNRYPTFLNPEIIVSIAGKIFRILFRGSRGTVKVLFDGNIPRFTHAWFAQGFEWLFIQDGAKAPIIWDGKNLARRSDIVAREMPIGSVMEFIHGRMVVASADGKNQIFVGDIVYGGDTTTTSDIIKFTEQQYWAEGGSFGAPIFIGDIVGLYSMPYLDTGTGQNELVVMGEDGFTSLDLSGPRLTWLDTSVQRVSMIGQGGVSSHGFSGLNGDLFYRRADGIGSYRNARVEYTQQWRQTPISREVNYWLKHDRQDLLEYIPMVSFQNMIMCGVSPMREAPNNSCAGFHRYCRGFVVMDAEPASTTGRDGNPAWQGMWTGMRPTAFVAGRVGSQERAFAMSYDRDGRNRLYEITVNDDSDFFGEQRRKIFSFYTTGQFGVVEARTNAFQIKKFTGGVIEVSGLNEAIEFDVDYKPDGSACWVNVDHGAPGCDCVKTWERDGCQSHYTAPNFARKYFESIPTDKCLPGSTQLAGTFHHCQVRVRMTGRAVVDRMNIRMEAVLNSQLAACLANNCDPVTCCLGEYDFAYHIAPTGSNAEIPDVVCPVPPVVRFTSTRTVTIRCQDYPSMSSTAQGQAESSISQTDADAKALAVATANAQAALNCPQCSPETLDEFVIDGGARDLSAFFAVGAYVGNEGRPIRLQDLYVPATIFLGNVNASGTLEAVTFYAYAHGTWDDTTKIYTDGGGSTTHIAFELGCNIGGTPSWPMTPVY